MYIEMHFQISIKIKFLTFLKFCAQIPICFHQYSYLLTHFLWAPQHVIKSCICFFITIFTPKMEIKLALHALCFLKNAEAFLLFITGHVVSSYEKKKNETRQCVTISRFPNQITRQAFLAFYVIILHHLFIKSS